MRPATAHSGPALSGNWSRYPLETEWAATIVHQAAIHFTDPEMAIRGMKPNTVQSVALAKRDRPRHADRRYRQHLPRCIRSVMWECQLPGPANRRLSEAVHLGRGFPARDEFTQERKEESLADASDRRFGFEIERLSDDIRIIFIKDDPETQIGIASGPPLFDYRYLSGKVPFFRLLGRDREEQHHVAIRPG